ncbi:MAG: 4-alpha-glucanotransferase, partial [Clostridiales bacterium]|nr:4-alpha-glucanotransferase [Candidatus Blautia equi]
MRASGVLLPVSSIPSKYGIGCFSKEAYEVVDQLVSAGQQYWQILPLGPTGYGDSPYQAFSTFAGNPYFIDLEDLIEKKLLTVEECEAIEWFGHVSYVDYDKQYQNRFVLLRKAFERFDTSDADFQAFMEEEKFWLEDYCLYMAIKNSVGGKGWIDWPKELKTRQAKAIAAAKTEFAEEILFYAFQQYFFTRQWDKLKAYANESGIKIIGDVPIYVAFDSADAWSAPALFQFNRDREPKSVAGCPPDAFSATGQLWGNPVYNWKNHKKDGYSWWIKRMESAMRRYDVARIDHFRGFDEYYAIPYGDKTAEHGKWEKGPGLELFDVLKEKVEGLEVIAEDLGVLTDSVLEMLKNSGFPGMKVLQFAFDDTENSSYLPYKYESPNCVVYTGTHDNETTKGWLENQNEHDNRFVREYICCYDAPVNDCVWGLIRAAMASVADLCIIPIQDYLCLGNEARMNAPSTLGDNWKWRLTKGQISEGTLYTMKELTR